MKPDCTPVVWPAQWGDPSVLDALDSSPVICLLFDPKKSPQSLPERAARLGIKVLGSGPPPDVALVKGEFPGIRTGDGNSEGSAGPTGAPWVDSNGWLIRLTRLQTPGKAVWVRSESPKRLLSTASYLLAVADAAAYGGRWVLNLDPAFSARIARREPEAVSAWKKLVGAIDFFARHGERDAWRPRAVLAVVSNFSGSNEFVAGEILNLTARQHQPYQTLDISQLNEASLRGLKAAIYPDSAPPQPDHRRLLLSFVEGGGLLLVGPKWGAPDGSPASGEPVPGYQVRVFGKGRIAVGDMQDPFLVATGAQVLMSHRHDLVRFWNGGALGSYLVRSPDGARTLLHILNYATRPGSDPVTVRVAGRYRTAQFQTLEDSAPRPLKIHPQRGAAELHLPPISVYAALELVA